MQRNPSWCTGRASQQLSRLLRTSLMGHWWLPCAAPTTYASLIHRRSRYSTLQALQQHRSSRARL